MAEIEQILIVGGGIAGLSLATALRRQGFAPELVERSPTWPAVGAGIIIPANGVRALRALGLGESVARTAAVLPSWAFFDQRGEPLCATDLADLWREVGPCLGITRVRLQEALRAGAAAVPHRLGVSLTALAQEDDRVVARFSDGTSGVYDLVVGADGIHSTVRTLALGAITPRYAGQIAWRNVIPTRPHGLRGQMVFLGDGRFFGLVPMGEGMAYGFGAVDAERFTDPLAGRLERFRHRFAAFGGPVPEYLAALRSDEQLHATAIEWVDVDEWYRGRVVLIGDAAHAGPPHMGEGGCMAMEDALVLAEELRAAENIEGALAAYVARRRPRTEWVQEQSRIAARGWVRPPEERNAALRAWGDAMLRARYRPLIPAP